MPSTAVAIRDIGLERYRSIDARIEGAEQDGLRARWEFGCLLLQERVGRKLPNGRLAEVAAAIGKGAQEVSARLRFASDCPTEAAFFDAVKKHGSWHAVCEAFGRKQTLPTATLETSVTRALAAGRAFSRGVASMIESGEHPSVWNLVQLKLYIYEADSYVNQYAERWDKRLPGSIEDARALLEGGQ